MGEPAFVYDTILQQGDVVGDRYTIERELGRGGSATIYLAQDRKHRRQVAVKVLHPELAASVGAKRFLREIEIAAGLSHPHILPLHDSGEDHGALYYVMPFVEGETLRSRLLREPRLPVDEAIHIAREVADALAYAHSQGLVHRDIKPENILLSHGHPLITDFGIAIALCCEPEQLTMAGFAVGTAAYMSPEQAAGERDIDERSDIYSLGCVLFEMLAGEPPFTGGSAQSVIARRFAGPPPDLAALREGVPVHVVNAVTRALARAAADRFATAAEFRQALLLPSTGEARRTTPAEVPPRSIAVLPFANMSADAGNDFFSDGVSEEIINALTAIRALRVAARTSSFAFKGKTQDIRTIGDMLGVRYVLEGSVRRSGRKMRITAQLIDAADGYHLWSDRYDRDIEDVFEVQDDIARNIAGALRLVLSEGEHQLIAKVPTQAIDAYLYYLRGRQYFHQFRYRTMLNAERMYQQAIEIDPNYALAYAGLADCRSFVYQYWDPAEENARQADEYSRRALELDPELAEAHASRGLALSFLRRFDEADTHFENAMRLNPQLFEAHYFNARSRFARGDYEHAAECFAHASKVRPEDLQAPGLLAMTYRKMGRHEDALNAYRKHVELVERQLTLDPNDVRALCLGAISYANLGERKRGLELADRALTLEPEDTSVLYNLACAFSLLSEPDRAFAALTRRIGQGNWYLDWLERDPDLDSLRADPRWEDFMGQIRAS
jgi:serine/threonine protein kinase/Tfp pilus assembly protein PilF